VSVNIINGNRTDGRFTVSLPRIDPQDEMNGPGFDPCSKPSEQLRAQREFLLADGHRWVKNEPVAAGEGCLVARRFADVEDSGPKLWGMYVMPGYVQDYLDRALTLLGKRLEPHAVWWNDHCAGTLDEVLEVLEVAEKLAVSDGC
jgi:hypothetical protein